MQAASSGCQSKPQKSLSEGIGAGAKPSFPSCSNLRFLAVKNSGFLPHPGFVDDQSTAKNMCPTTTETREVGKTDPE